MVDGQISSLHSTQAEHMQTFQPTPTSSAIPASRSLNSPEVGFAICRNDDRGCTGTCSLFRTRRSSRIFCRQSYRSERPDAIRSLRSASPRLGHLPDGAGRLIGSRCNSNDLEAPDIRTFTRRKGRDRSVFQLTRHGLRSVAPYYYRSRH